MGFPQDLLQELGEGHAAGGLRAHASLDVRTDLIAPFIESAEDHEPLQLVVMLFNLQMVLTGKGTGSKH